MVEFSIYGQLEPKAQSSEVKHTITLIYTKLKLKDKVSFSMNKSHEEILEARYTCVNEDSTVIYGFTQGS